MMATFVRISGRFINLDNVTTVERSLTDPGTIFVSFNYGITTDEGAEGSWLSLDGKDAAAFVVWLEAHSENVQGSF